MCVYHKMSQLQGYSKGLFSMHLYISGVNLDQVHQKALRPDDDLTTADAVSKMGCGSSVPSHCPPQSEAIRERALTGTVGPAGERRGSAPAALADNGSTEGQAARVGLRRASAPAALVDNECARVLMALGTRGDAMRDGGPAAADVAFDSVARLLDADESNVMAMLERDLLRELLSILKDKAQQPFHGRAGQLLDTLQTWALDTVQHRSHNTTSFQPAARCLMALVEHTPPKMDPEAKPVLKRTSSVAGLKRTSSFESNLNGLYPEMVIEFKKPYRIVQVNEPWEQAFGHRKNFSKVIIQ